ncbi:MAG: primosomal protein N' [Fimbriimonas sp.]
MPKLRVADVALDPRSGGAEALYTYRADLETRPGEAVYVPLGTRSAMGFVTSVYEATEADLGFSFERLRPVSGQVEGLSLPEPLVDLAKYVAEEYLCSLPVALSPAVPPGVRDRLATCWTLVGEPTKDLTPLQQEVVRTLADNGGFVMDQKSKPLPASSLRVLRLLKNKGLVKQTQRLLPFGEKRKSQSMLRLTSDSLKVEEFLKGAGKKRPAQALTVMRLQSAERAAFSASEIKALAGVTDATLKALTEAGLLESSEGLQVTKASPPTPNRYQRLAIDAIVDPVSRRAHEGFLLYGVTGSGKTEVYLRAAAEALRIGRQVLYIVPEIALATQAIAQLRERFGQGIALMHSELPAAERLQNWLRIRSGEAGVILGARSALFAPISNLGLIIVDEEHEGSYKQESAPRYHAKSVAMYLGERHKCPVVLGSATPSVESYYEAEQMEMGGHGLTLLSLPERAADASLPEVDIEDLTLGYRAGRPVIVTPELDRRIRATLDKGQQVIIFLNRRAYSPSLLCRDCGFRPECPNCAVSLSYHQRDGRLRCHHCGYARRLTPTCPKCGGQRLNPLGAGTEKVEEMITEMFPDSRVARLDRDIARKKGALEEVLASFRSGDIGILVGTQMVAKGLDFPNVTLVGVIAADVSLNIPDFRSSERTFQLLSQVAGRAGRGKAIGTVVVQTFNPLHPSIVASQTHDYPSFYEHMRKEREEAGYPPFRRLVNVLLSSEDRTALIQATEEVTKRLHALEPAVQPLGPVDCAVERLQGKWRRHVLLKLAPETSPKPIAECLLGFSPKGVTILLDVDPYNLM